MSYIQAIIIAIVEGLTEFLPISSTGHMIIASSILGIDMANNDFVKLFLVAIQLGAILAVVVFYYKKFINFKSWQFYLKLLVAVIPALALGKLLSDKIDEILEKPLPIAIALLLGGFVLLFVDNFFKNNYIDKDEDITYKKGFLIGVWQCLALMPGISRSAASIIGGMSQKLTRSAAAEFSFFLAVPTMFAATGYKLLKVYLETPEVLKNTDNLKLLAVGNIVAFIVAILAIKFFIDFLKKYGFKLFGWYRIIAGALVIILLQLNIIK